MASETTKPHRQSARVIVLGNEKGGTGKSTLALHIAVALLKAGQRVAMIDLDGRQRSLTRYLDNRLAWARACGLDLAMPAHSAIAPGLSMSVAENEALEAQQFAAAVEAAEHAVDFIVIDTPGADTYLMRLAHSMADTLVTPINDSFLDVDVLGVVDAVSGGITGAGHYARMVREARRSRRRLDGASMDWIVVRNRLSLMAGRNNIELMRTLRELSSQVGFRPLDGFAERSVYREFFPRGLTALDDLDGPTLGRPPHLGHVTARDEVHAVLRQLRLPLDERGRRRAANRAEWQAQAGTPLELEDFVEV